MMDEKTRKNLKKAARSLLSLIDKATEGSAEISIGHAEATDIHSGLTDVAPDGEIFVYFKLYVPERDKRAELFTRCGTRP